MMGWMASSREHQAESPAGERCLKSCIWYEERFTQRRAHRRVTARVIREDTWECFYSSLWANDAPLGSKIGHE